MARYKRTLATLLLLLTVSISFQSPATAQGPDQSGLYNAIKQGFAGLQAEIDSSSWNATSDQVFAIRSQVMRDDPSIVHLDYSKSFYWTNGRLEFVYTQPKIELVALRNRYQQAVAAIVAKAVDPAETKLKQLLSIYDYILQHASYGYIAGEDNEIAHAAHGILLYGQGVCESYAKAMVALLQAIDIECIYVTGTARGEGHGWNIVRIDGQYYHLDATWDDPVPDQKDKVNYRYLLQSDQTMRQDHSWDATQYPVCNDDRFSYFRQMTDVARVGDWYYYSDADNEQLYRIHADGSGATRLLSQRVAHLASDEQSIFYSDLSNGGYLSRWQIATGTSRRLNTRASERIQAVNGLIYFYAWDSDTLYSIQPDGNAETRVTTGIPLPADEVSPVAEPSHTILLLLGDKQASINGVTTELPVAPFVDTRSSTTMVPLRFISEALGADVRYLPDRREIQIRLQDRVVILVLDRATALVNGQTVGLARAANSIAGNTFVPLRFVSESLGATVDYQPALRLIMISQKQST